MPRRVRLNSAGAREILNSPEVRAELHHVANPIRERCQATAPVDTGTFARSFVVQEAITDRAVVRVVSTDPLGLFKEAKSATMRRALG